MFILGSTAQPKVKILKQRSIKKKRSSLPNINSKQYSYNSIVINTQVTKLIKRKDARSPDSDFESKGVGSFKL